MTHTNMRFADVDAILLVDNAAQPIQAAAQLVMRAAAASGCYSKLLIALTHFHQVRGLGRSRSLRQGGVESDVRVLREIGDLVVG